MRNVVHPNVVRPNVVRPNGVLIAALYTLLSALPLHADVGGYAMPTVQDEKNTYTRWGWTWNADQEPGAIIDPISNYTVFDPDVHYDTEADDLWVYLMMSRRGGSAMYLNRANAWARYFKDDYRNCVPTSSGQNFCFDHDAFGGCHMYGWGLLALYEHNGDAAALAEAEQLGANVEALWAPNSSFGCYPAGACMWWGPRGAARHLLLITRLAQVTGNPRWITLRDKIINLIMANNWDSTYGMFFEGEPQTDDYMGIPGAYANGARIQSSMMLGMLDEALFKAYLATGRTDIKDRLIAMARFVDQYGLDPTYQYTASVFGIRNGRGWYSYSSGPTVTFWDPVYTTSLVNILVMGYKLTGDVNLLNRAKYFFNRGTKGIYGEPVQRAAPDNVVHHFVDTLLDTSHANFYLSYNKSELQYTYLLFENGGLPTVLSQQGPDTTPPVVAMGFPANGYEVLGTVAISAAASDSGGPVAGIQFRLDGVNFGAEDVTVPFMVNWDTTREADGSQHVITAVARDQAGNQAVSAPVTVTVNNAAPITPPNTILLVDFGGTSAANTFGLSGWSTVLKDGYTDYEAIGPGGMSITIGNNGAYNFQGISGPARAFAAGETILVTWYNNVGGPLTFTPKISFDDPDRNGSGVTGTWVNMTAVSMPAGGTRTSQYVLTSAEAGAHTLVNVNINFDNTNGLICDKIQLVGLSGGSDTTAPSIPQGLTATAVSASQINLSWIASTDAVGVSGYRIFSGSTYLNSTTGTSFQVTGLSPSTTYSYTVEAYDFSGNTSGRSSPPTSAITLPPGSTPPPPPGGTNPPPSSGPTHLTLDLPSVLALNATLSVTYPSTWTVSHFDWSITESPASASSHTAASKSLVGSSIHIPSQAASASLASLGLVPGPYTITVIAYGSSNQILDTASASVTLVQADLSVVKVYPNPWRSDKHRGGITFSGLPSDSTVKLFTTSGHLVRQYNHITGQVIWDRANESGDTAASGVYVYLITTPDGAKKRGKVAIIK